MDKDTKELLAELGEKHREIKKELLDILNFCDGVEATNEAIRDRLFKLYLKVK